VRSSSVRSGSLAQVATRSAPVNGWSVGRLSAGPNSPGMFSASKIPAGPGSRRQSPRADGPLLHDRALGPDAAIAIRHTGSRAERRSGIARHSSMRCSRSSGSRPAPRHLRPPDAVVLIRWLRCGQGRMDFRVPGVIDTFATLTRFNVSKKLGEYLCTGYYLGRPCR
jgi:hypothetical protein